MTTGPFREVDLDLLADYVGGALAGTPDEATVARLVTEDEAWSRAYAELAPAVALVSADLAAWGEPVDTMPAAVGDRLVAALAGAGPAAPPTVPLQPGAGRQLTTVGATGQRGGTGRTPRRWSRRAGPVLVAAAAVAAAGFGVTQFVSTASDGGSVAGSAQRENADTAASAAGGFRLTTEPTRTGNRYTPDLLARMPAGPGVLSQSTGPPAQVDSQGGGPRRSGPAADLERLTDRAALDACLGEVSVAHGAGPIAVDRLEYAIFQDEPALVIGLVDATGARWVVVAGPECGVPGSGADSRYRTRVG